MGRRRRNREEERLEAGIKAVVAILCLVALGIGGINGFLPALISLVMGLLFLALSAGIIWIAVRFIGANRAQEHEDANSTDQSYPIPSFVIPPRRTEKLNPDLWNYNSVLSALGEIDWYQFEKFCGALLQAEGFTVERRGGAQPDGGVDLVVSQGELSALIQCKHWRTWTVQEKVVREMLGSMTHFKVQQGAIFTLKGATQPARSFAAQHDIDIVDGAELAKRALMRLPVPLLSSLLSSREHHCPKCESVMLWRTGNFDPFWGCSRFPRCRSVLRYSGAK